MKGQRRRNSSRSPAAFVTDPTIRVGMCTPCDKVIFLSRKVARYAAGRAVGGVRPRAYRCPTNTALWHVGHIPEAVRRGVIDRDQWARHKGWPA